MINPAGIIFGEGARLDIGGSFYGSTASSILFEDGEFSAADLENLPLLTVNAPIGLGFRDNPGDIVNRSDLAEISLFEDETGSEFTEIERIGLQVNEGKNIALIGGDILIDNSAISTFRGNLTFGSVSKASVVTFNNDGTFVFPKGIQKGDISLFSSNTTSRSAFINSDIVFEGGLLEENNIDFVANTISLNDSVVSGADSFVAGAKGNINLVAESISLDNAARLQSDGEINLTANSISLNNESAISLLGIGEATIGDINLTANSISLNNSFIASNILSFFFEGEVTIGDINLTANSISLNSSEIIVDLIGGKGTIGDINLNANSISLNNESSIASSYQFVPSIFSTEDIGGRIGDTNLSADSISLNNSVIVSQNFEGEGRIGDINLNANSISLDNQASIQTQSDTLAQASNIKIDAAELIYINGKDSTISTQTGGLGNAGNIIISTNELNILDSGQISANNFIVETFQIAGGELIRNILEQPQEGSGNAGTIDITADNITLSDRGGITALSSAGEGGNINLQVDDVLSLRGNSEISATAGELDTPGNGGNVTIDSQFIVAFPDGNNDITANAFSGAGGNITIATEGIFGIQERPNNPLTNDITASSEAGISGNITITTPDINPVQGTTELSTNVVEPGETTQQVCQANREAAAKNGLTISGKGGIVPDPALPLNSLNVTVNGEINPTSTIPAPIETSQGKIQPARGIKVTESGKIILTAYRTNNAGERIPEGSRNCDRA